jgi:hypothetical protein
MARTPARLQESRVTFADPENAPVRLTDVAAEIGMPAEALRQEGKAGRLVIWRVRRKDYTSLAEIRRMFERCRVTPEVPACGSAMLEHAPAGEQNSRSGSSATGTNSSAQAAALETVRRLREGSQPISRPNTRRSGASAALLPFPSPTS